MKRLAAITTVAALALTGAAHADTYDPALDVTFDLGSFNTNDLPQTFTFEMDPASTNVVGFSFSGDLAGISPFGAAHAAQWTQLQITAPDGFEFIVGGFDDETNDVPWDFAGTDGTWNHGVGGDEGPGQFGDGEPEFAFDNIPLEGSWSFTFVQTGGGQNPEWSNVTVTLHQVPAPGALALLGLAGCLSRSRRRT